MAEERVTVSFDLSRGPISDEDVARLKQAGLTVDVVMAPMGVVNGWLDRAAQETLRRVPGVVGLERERQIRLPDEGEPQ